MSTRWYFASLLYRYQPESVKRGRTPKRIKVEETWHLFSGRNRAEVQAKIRKDARVNEAIEMVDMKTGEKGHWVFAGIKELWLIYDKIEDGAEIAWIKHDNITALQLKKMLKSGDRRTK